MAEPVKELFQKATNLASDERGGDLLVMPEGYHPSARDPYFKDESKQVIFLGDTISSGQDH